MSNLTPLQCFLHLSLCRGRCEDSLLVQGFGPHRSQAGGEKQSDWLGSQGCDMESVKPSEGSKLRFQSLTHGKLLDQ